MLLTAKTITQSLKGVLLLLLGVLLLNTPASLAANRDRTFLPLTVEFLDQTTLPSQTVEGTTVGGLSALAYDRTGDRFLALSDDHRGQVPPHFYTLRLDLQPGESPKIAGLTVEGVTFLKDVQGEPLRGGFDPEGLAFKPDGTLFVSSEFVSSEFVSSEIEPQGGGGPAIAEFDGVSGRLRRFLPVPQRFVPQSEGEPAQQVRGIQRNLGFESLTLAPSGFVPSRGEPVRLFTATEGPLVQDQTAKAIDTQERLRFLHYYLGEGPVLILGEYLYPLDPAPLALLNGLSDLLAIDNSGHFLALERALMPTGFQVKLFQMALGPASDVSGVPSLRGALRGVMPIQKKLLLDLSALNLGLENFRLDNLEGLSWGPQLPDGSRTLVLISDDNFQKLQKTQVILLRVRSQR